MTVLHCEDCGKRYTYEIDDFCPRCGAYNHPRKSSGATLRVDGLLETNHVGSFSHKEVHREKIQRRALNLDKDPVSPIKIAENLAEIADKSRKNVSQPKKKTGVAAVFIWLFIMLEIIIMLLD